MRIPIVTAPPSLSTPKRIAVFRPCGLGDAAQVSPLLQQIHSDCPEAEIHFFTCEGIPALFEGAPYLTASHAFNNAILQKRSFNWGGFPIWREIGKYGPWDYLLSLDFQFRRALSIRFARSRVTAGLQSERRRWFSPYTHVIRLNPDELQNQARGHVSLNYLQLWSAATGFPDSGFGYDLRHLLKLPAKPPGRSLPDRFICLAPGTGNIFSRIPTKQWPFAHWLELARLLIQKGREIVWIGGRDELAAFGEPPVGRNLMGQLNLVQLAHVLGASSLCVAQDSGPFHLSLALGTRAIAIFGPTSSVRLGPFRTPLGMAVQSTLPCVPCGRPECLVQLPGRGDADRPYCMTDLKPADMAAKIAGFLDDEKAINP